MLSNCDLLIGSEVPNFCQSIRAATQNLLSVGAPVDAQQRVRARLLGLGGGLTLRANLIHGHLRDEWTRIQHRSTTNTHTMSTRRRNGHSAIVDRKSGRRRMMDWTTPPQLIVYLSASSAADWWWRRAAEAKEIDCDQTVSRDALDVSWPSQPCASLRAGRVTPLQPPTRLALMSSHPLDGLALWAAAH